MAVDTGSAAHCLSPTAVTVGISDEQRWLTLKDLVKLASADDREFLFHYPFCPAREPHQQVLFLSDCRIFCMMPIARKKNPQIIS